MVLAQRDAPGSEPGIYREITASDLEPEPRALDQHLLSSCIDPIAIFPGWR
jgi:hypothetical protein